MTNYTKTTNFTTKDTLPVGDAQKKVKGSEFDTEFNAIATAIETKADLASPALTGTPTAPTASAGTNTTQIATTAFVVANSVPSGAILLWSGSTGSIPTGFVLCDGTNSTPDLRNRFVVGAGDTYAVNATGGSADAIVPAHTHSITDPGHTHTVGILTANDLSGGSGTSGSNTRTPLNSYTTSSATTGITVNQAGESATNANLPPYYALAYIMKT